MKIDKDSFKSAFGNIDKDIRVRKGASKMVRHTKVHDADKSGYSKKDRRQGKPSKNAVYEQRILTNVRLTDHQNAVLCKVLSSGNENFNVSDLVANTLQEYKQNFTSAVKTLQDLHLLDVAPGNALGVTQTGISTLKSQNLIDDSNQLTEEGQQLINQFTVGEEGMDQNQVDQQMDMAIPDVNPPPFGESFSMLKGLMENIEFENKLNTFKKR